MLLTFEKLPKAEMLFEQTMALCGVEHRGILDVPARMSSLMRGHHENGRWATSNRN